MFFLRLIKHIMMFLILLPLQVVGGVLLFVYLPIHRKLGLIKLPYILRWFDNADMYVNRDTNTYLNTIVPTSFWTQYCWLAWRNPLNYFGYVILGYQITETDILKINSTLTNVGDGIGQTSGLFYAEVVDASTVRAYEYYYIYKYSATKCFRFRMGHKIGQDIKPGQYCQYVSALSPYHSYNGV